MKLLKCLVVATFLLGYASPAQAASTDPAFSGLKIINGSCTANSHTAEGPIGADLTARQSRFFCDSVAVIFFSDAPDHVMVTFSEKKAHRVEPIAFAGKASSDGILVDVSSLYLRPGIRMPITEGGCKFFFRDHGRVLKEIFCGAKFDEDGRRTTAVIAFEATAEEKTPPETEGKDGNPFVVSLQQCFAKHPIKLSQDEMSALVAKNDYSFLEPPSACRTVMDSFVTYCTEHGSKRDECSGRYAALWIRMNNQQQ